MAADPYARLLARSLSVLGHPAVLMPTAVVGAALVQQAPRRIMLVAAGATLFIALFVGLFSIAQVRAGHWQHVDASVPHERSQLHRVLSAVMFGVAGLLWALGQPHFMSTALALGGAIVLFAWSVSRWLKVSLHVAFAVFAACLLWPATSAVGLCLVLVAGVGWSRLALRRHTAAEVLLGLVSGTTAGIAFNLCAR